MIELEDVYSCVSAMLFLYTGFCIGLYIFLPFVSSSDNFQRQFRGKRALIVTSHPDDECMFFAPTILRLSQYMEVHLLCVTSGNYYQQGEVRKKEIVKSGGILHLSPDHIQVLDNSQFPDDPQVKWDEEVVSQEILKVIDELSPNVVISFDDYGVSGHNNHRTLSRCLRLCQTAVEKETHFFSLESVGLLRKYSAFLDLPPSHYSSPIMFQASPAMLFRAQRAMVAHWSQFVWFRALYVIFSRYMLINTLREVVVIPEEARKVEKQD